VSFTYGLVLVRSRVPLRTSGRPYAHRVLRVRDLPVPTGARVLTGSCRQPKIPNETRFVRGRCRLPTGWFSYPRAVVCVRAGSRTLAGASAYELAPVCSQGLAPTGYSRTHTGWCAYVLCGRPCVGVRATLVRTRPRLRTGSSRTHMAAVAYEIWTNDGQPIRLLVFCT
jgi:hypothetical protein